MMRNPKRQASVALVIGMIGLAGLTGNPRLQTYRAVDVVQLVASGACFGVALTLLLARRRIAQGE
jgi:cyanate permease